MKITFLSLMVCCLFNVMTFAQDKYFVVGNILDTAINLKISDAYVCVLRAKDSAQVNCVKSQNGAFKVSLSPGNYILKVSAENYRNFTAGFYLDSINNVKIFLVIPMLLKTKLLSEITIREKIVPIKIKGDTTEFNADAYKTEKNAKVDEIIRQLPGIKINQQGVIFYQGQVINKILLDGDDFFGDPSLILKNIRSDMVKSIQIYNERSELSKLTAIDDGVKIRTLNVHLREDKTRGIFGNVQVGYGSDDYRIGQGILNKFNAKEKFAVYGNITNTAENGLGDNSPGYDGFGLPERKNTGAQYSNKWNKDQNTINANYTLGSIDVNGSTISNVQNNLPDDYNKINQQTSKHQYRLEQKLNTALKLHIDSSMNLEITLNSSNSHFQNQEKSFFETLRGDGSLLNTNTSNTRNSTESSYLKSYTLLTKRLNKKGDNLSFYTAFTLNRSHSDSYLQNQLQYFNSASLLDSSRITDQFKPNKQDDSRLSVGLTLLRVPSSKTVVSIGYNLIRNFSNNYNGSFNKSPIDGTYSLPDILYSNDYHLTDITNRFIFGFTYYTKNTYFFVNSSVSPENLKQTDLLSDTSLTRKFLNLNIYTRLTYKFNEVANLEASYAGNNIQPGINQLQPLKQNYDPLNITVGNPLLKPSFRNNIDVLYHIYFKQNDWNIMIRTSYSTQLNAIVNNRTTDSAGVNTYKWSNLKNHNPESWDFHAETYFHLPKIDFIVTPGISISKNSNYSYVNSKLNQFNYMNYNPSLSIAKNRAKYSFYFDVAMNYAVNKTSLETLENNNRNYTSHLNFKVTLPAAFFIGAETGYEFTAKNAVFDRNFSRTLVKAFMGRNFLKEQNLKLTISGNDLLNQNTGYSRSGNSDSFVEEQNTVIRRYFMLALTWDFSKFGKSLQVE